MSLHLGYEKGTGEEVSILLNHTFITGITQSGKTITAKTLAERVRDLGYTVLVVDVKRNPTGARDFLNLGYEIPIYLKETVDSLTLKSLLEADSKLRLNFQFPELIRVCEKAENMNQVLDNIQALLLRQIHPIRKDKLEVLRLLMQRLMAEFSKVKISKTLEVVQGEINVMDLTPYSEAFKQIVVKSVAEYIRQNLTKIVLISDECHIHIPQKYGSASKQAVTWLIKEGAGSQQYVFLIDQSVTEIDKGPLKQMENWILGRQRELNEAVRAYKQLPFKAGVSVETIMRLQTGFFFVSTSTWVKQAYVQPLGVSQEDAISISQGLKSIEDLAITTTQKVAEIPLVPSLFSRARIEAVEENLEETKKLLAEEQEKAIKLQETVTTLQRETETIYKPELKKLQELVTENEVHIKKYESLSDMLRDLMQLEFTPALKEQIDKIVYARVDEYLNKMVVPNGVYSEPTSEMTLNRKLINFKLNIKRESLDVDALTVRGQILCIGLEGKLEQVKLGDIVQTLLLGGFHPRRQTVANELEELVRLGALIRHSEGGQFVYQTSQDFQNLVKKEAA